MGAGSSSKEIPFVELQKPLDASDLESYEDKTNLRGRCPPAPSAASFYWKAVGPTRGTIRTIRQPYKTIGKPYKTIGKQ